MAGTTVKIGTLVLLIAAASIFYVTLSTNDVRVRIDSDKSLFYVRDGSKWIITGQQEDRLFNGSAIVNRITSSITMDYKTEGIYTTVTRNTTFNGGAKISHSWVFNNDVTDKALFPVGDNVRVSGGDSLQYRFTLKKLTETGPKRKLTNETTLAFGNNMKVVFPADYSWAWIGWPYGADSFSVQYKIDSDDKTFNFRFFDPTTPQPYFTLPASNNTYTQNESYVFINVTVAP